MFVTRFRTSTKLRNSDSIETADGIRQMKNRAKTRFSDFKRSEAIQAIHGLFR
jgi:hypothetical protein